MRSSPLSRSVTDASRLIATLAIALGILAFLMVPRLSADGAAAVGPSNAPIGSSPIATNTPSPTPSPVITPSSEPSGGDEQLSSGGQDHPGGPPDEVGGELDVACPNGLECP